MLNKAICTFTVTVAFIIVACGDDNPTNFYAESSSSETTLSSSIIGQSSSNDIIESSSSLDAISSSTEISSSGWVPYSYGELIDERDGQIYKTIKIGEQTWMAENLNFAYALPTSKKDSSNTNNKPESRDKYGKLYRWSIAMDSAEVFSKDGKGCGNGVNCGSQPSKGVRGVCPENWHIPNEKDIKNIIDFSKTSNDKLNWIEHYWFLTESEDNVFKAEMELKYDDFWTSVQLDIKNSKGLVFGNNKMSTSSTPKGAACPVRCVKDDKIIQVEHGTMTDERDGQVYKTVKIGDQTWMAENLNYAYPHKFRNLDSASWCYNNESGNCAKYGRLYMWEAAMNCNAFEYTDSHYDYDDFCTEDIYMTEESFNFYRGTCPENWHIPSHDEWALLKSTVNNFATDLKSTVDWRNNGNGSDILGFSALPAGECEAYSGGKCTEINEKTCFWTTRQIDRTIHDIAPETWDDYFWASIFCLTANSKDIFNEVIDKYDYALSVRCVKDN